MFELLLSFLQVGAFSIGGGYATLPLIQEQIVELHQWLTYKEFTDIITISQMTPGPLAVNGSTFVGLRVAGIWGAIIATFGCVISGIIISLSLHRFFQNHHSPLIETSFKALKSISVGLIASAASTILLLSWFGANSLQTITHGADWAAVGISFAAIILLRRLRFNPITVMLISGFAGVLIY